MNKTFKILTSYLRPIKVKVNNTLKPIRINWVKFPRIKVVDKVYPIEICKNFIKLKSTKSSLGFGTKMNCNINVKLDVISTQKVLKRSSNLLDEIQEKINWSTKKETNGLNKQ